MLSRIRTSQRFFYFPKIFAQWGFLIMMEIINLSDLELQLRWFKGRWILKSMCEGSGKGLSFLVWSLCWAQLHHLSLCQAFILLGEICVLLLPAWPCDRSALTRTLKAVSIVLPALLHLSCVCDSEVSGKGVWLRGACASISTIKLDSGAALVSVRTNKSDETSLSVFLSFQSGVWRNSHSKDVHCPLS